MSLLHKINRTPEAAFFSHRTFCLHQHRSIIIEIKTSSFIVFFFLPSQNTKDTQSQLSASKLPRFKFNFRHSMGRSVFFAQHIFHILHLCLAYFFHGERRKKHFSLFSLQTRIDWFLAWLTCRGYRSYVLWMWQQHDKCRTEKATCTSQFSNQCFTFN